AFVHDEPIAKHDDFVLRKEVWLGARPLHVLHAGLAPKYPGIWIAWIVRMLEDGDAGRTVFVNRASDVNPRPGKHLRILRLYESTLPGEPYVPGEPHVRSKAPISFHIFRTSQPN